MVKRVLFVLFLSTASATYQSSLELHPQHLKYFTHSNNDLLAKCNEDISCPVETNTTRCWGFESTCSRKNSYSAEIGVPTCEKGKETASDTFWKQADWGYVRERADLFAICSSVDEKGTSLVCSKNLQYCYAKNIFFDFRHFKVKGSARYRNDIILEGDVGGNCQKLFEQNVLKENLRQKSYLQSWGHELEQFSSIPSFEVDKENCDVIFEGPTILQKQDASVNLFHHFCDFVNLYVSQHINGSFSRDVQIIWWDTAESGFVDALFGDTWKSFSRKKPLELLSLAGNRVCFKDVMLPLLARQPFGLFYNMPLIQGCSGSGLIHAFAHHILHRLDVPESVPDLETVRVTILSRSTTHRKILNIREIEQAVRSLPSVRLQIVDYNHHLPFLDQLKTTHSTDVFIGMHGAGLTHLLFLPDWAAVFEIYHCEDRGCYRDLARIRGVKYFTWPDQKLHLIIPDNNDDKREKFVNYSFDVDEFKNQVQKMVEWVRRHPKFTDARRKERRRLKKLEL